MIWKSRLERMARSMAVACALSIVAALAGLSTGWASLPTSGILLFCGGLTGAIWAASVKTPALSSAQWLDQRLDLKDLLATAWSVPGRDSAWECSILAMADAACRPVDPGRVKHPLANGQAWSAIALGAALTLTLGMIGPVVKQLNASASIAGTIAPDAPAGLMQVASQAEAMRDRPAGDAALNEQSNRPAGNDIPGDDGTTGLPGSGNDSGAIANPSGMAAGVSRTIIQISPLSSPAVDVKGDTQASPQGRIASGGSGASPGGDRSAVTGYAPGLSTSTAAPWQSVSWPAAQAAAMQSILAGRVDPAYEPIVRDYFQRQ